MTGKEGGSDAGGGGTSREDAQVARELRSLEHADKTVPCKQTEEGGELAEVAASADAAQSSQRAAETGEEEVQVDETVVEADAAQLSHRAALE